MLLTTPPTITTTIVMHMTCELCKEEENRKAQNDNNNQERNKYNTKKVFIKATRNDNLHHRQIHSLPSRINMNIRMGDGDKKRAKLRCSCCISTGLLLFP